MPDHPTWPRDVAPVDYLLYRADTDPRTRSTMMSIELLESEPEWERLRDDFERASRLVPRLRQRVVAPLVPLGPPKWVLDPSYHLDYHLRRVRAPRPGGHRELLELAQTLHSGPLDLSRPLWEATLVGGLSMGDVKAALIVKLSHSITDGVGGVEMDRQIRSYDLTRAPGPMPAPPLEDPVGAVELTRQHLMRLPRNLLRGAVRGAGLIAGVTSKVVREPFATVAETRRMLISLQHMAGPPPVAPSPLLSGRSLNRRITTVELPLADLKQSAKRYGYSLNDAYLAALCGALRHYHEAMGCPVPALPLTLPVNLRTADKVAAGNHWGAVRIAAPVGELDPIQRMECIRDQVAAGRSEPAIGALSAMSPLLAGLPMSLVSALMAVGAACDVQASNVPGHLQDTYIGGTKVRAMYPVGPLPGAAIMSVLLSHVGRCYVGVNYDTEAVTDGPLLDEALKVGFAEVVDCS